MGVLHKSHKLQQAKDFPPEARTHANQEFSRVTAGGKVCKKCKASTLPELSQTCPKTQEPQEQACAYLQLEPSITCLHPDNAGPVCSFAQCPLITIA